MNQDITSHNSITILISPSLKFSGMGHFSLNKSFLKQYALEQNRINNEYRGFAKDYGFNENHVVGRESVKLVESILKYGDTTDEQATKGILQKLEKELPEKDKTGENPDYTNIIENRLDNNQMSPVTEEEEKRALDIFNGGEGK